MFSAVIFSDILPIFQEKRKKLQQDNQKSMLI